MLTPIAKVHLHGHRRQLDATLALLHRLHAIQIIDIADDPSVPLTSISLDDAHVRMLERLRSLRTRVDALLLLVPQPRTAPTDPEPVDLDEVATDLDTITPVVEELVTSLDELDAELDTLPRYITSLRKLLPLVPEISELTSYETAAILIDNRHAAVFSALMSELTELLDGRFEMISGRVDDTTTGAILVFPRTEADRVHTMLGREQVNRVHLPERFTGVPFRQAIAAMTERLDQLPDEILATKAAIADQIGVRNDWAAVAADISSRLERLEAARHLGGTAHTFTLSGWVAAAELDSLTTAINSELGGEVIVVEAEPVEDEQPPVAMENPAPAAWFGPLVRLLDVPKPGTIDPSWLMAIFLPLFFGIMLGDVVYGAAVLAGALWVGRRFAGSPVAASLGKVMAMAAIWAILWGVIYGEYLGDLGHRAFGIEPIWIDREEALVPLLLFSVAIGAAHVVLGMALGIVTSVKMRRSHETIERVALLVAMIGLFLIAGIISDRIPDGAITPAVAAVCVGLAVMMWAGGALGILMGPLDLIGTIGNVLSYLRLAAIGLASVYLARVANELGAAAPLLIGILVATLFHVLNLALGTFSPAIQALRLHYVEFFGKFYEPGGEPFTPFGAHNHTSSL